jgi:ABC-type transporter Mla subunit MlaD
VADSEKRTEMVVGLFLLIGLFLLGGLVLQFGRFRERMGGHYPVTVVFDDASGLIKGSEVRMGGANIGRVARLPELNEALQVEVEIAVNRGIRIPSDSSFQINSATLLGDKLIVIVPPAKKTGAYIDEGGRVRGAGPTGLEALQNNAEMISRDVVGFLKEAGQTLTKVDAAVDEIRAASKQLTDAGTKVNQSVLAKENLEYLDAAILNLAEASARWKETSAKLEPTLDATREAVAAVRSAASRTEKTLNHADETISVIGPAFEGIPAAVDRFSRASMKAEVALDRMAKGEGMLGAFASDNEVSLDFKAFMSNLRRHGILLYQDAGASPKPSSAQPFGGSHR